MKPALNSLPIGKSLPLSVGILHFVGIGGIGMSGIAEVLHNLGYKVQGSDSQASYNTKRLEDLGIRVFVGHESAHIGQASVVVISSAIKADNPELMAAREHRIPVVRRAEMLAELMRFKIAIAVAGTHGKTTTTALTAAMLEAGGFTPTVINGGIINARGTNAYLGKGEWMVVEADESDGTFTRLPASIGIITNIDPEHLDHYGSFEAAKAAFATFLTNLPFYGFAVLCTDHPEVQALSARVADRRIITYGTNPQADVRAANIRADADGQAFDVITKDVTIRDVMLSMHGEHNVKNALATIAIALELGMSPEKIKSALAKFEGVKRRFTKTGVAKGITVIDDYGHHPVEIAATLKAARAAQAASGGRVVAVVQPHRYTRLHDLFGDFCACFNDADTVIVSDVYSAGEPPIEGISGDSLVTGLRAAGHKEVVKLPSEEALAATVLAHAGAGDMVVCLGAGSITKWAYALPEQLAAL
ncbi:MAG: UDP-N-acetylmuramate--L-alanine ligase [Alphaproteobacteria bacterium]|nr:UDP-N-acetylmuramate--L-alanine ligase [Alphaproteobacteria bacterium]